MELWSEINDLLTIISYRDKLLENEYSIKAFVYIKDSKSRETYKTINLPVIKRKQPEAYVDVDDPTVDDKLAKILKGETKTKASAFCFYISTGKCTKKQAT